MGLDSAPTALEPRHLTTARILHSCVTGHPGADELASSPPDRLAAGDNRGEAGENAEREPLKLSEASDLARKMEAVLKPLAAERQSPGTNQHNEVGGKLPRTSEPKTRDVAAKTAGFSEGTIRKVREVREIIESETTPAPVRDAAVEGRWRITVPKCCARFIA